MYRLVRDETFCLAQGEHYALVSGKVFGPWPDVGAARAGLATEQRRQIERLYKGAENEENTAHE